MLGFEITPEDVDIVLNELNIKATCDQRNDIFDELINQEFRIEQAALNGGNSIETQIDAAYDEIKKILKEDGEISGIKFD